MIIIMIMFYYDRHSKLEGINNEWTGQRDASNESATLQVDVTVSVILLRTYLTWFKGCIEFILSYSIQMFFRVQLNNSVCSNLKLLTYKYWVTGPLSMHSFTNFY
jgi:hypothetical protein